MQGEVMQGVAHFQGDVNDYPTMISTIVIPRPGILLL